MDTLIFTPPPFNSQFEYKNCVQINNPVTKKRVYQTPDGECVPSVTTILSATKDTTHLDAWRARVGEERAKQITTEASGVGTAMHANLERFVAGLPRKPGNNTVHEIAHRMADQIIINGLSKVNEIWAMEQSLYFPGLYSGTTDLIAVYQGNPSVCDYKQSNKPKKDEYVEDYKLQLMAYIMAHNEVYKTNIREGHIFLCTRDCQYQQFDLWPADFDKYQDMWLTRVEDYYNRFSN